MNSNNNTNTTFKQTSIGLIPSDWEVKKLGELGEIIGGLTYSPDDISEEEGTLVLRSLFSQVLNIARRVSLVSINNKSL
jgi:hypothetical protein